MVTNYSNFGKDIREMSDQELVSLVNNSSPSFGSVASDELTRRELKALQVAIDKNTIQAKELGDSNERFSKLFAALAFVQLVIAWSQFLIDGVRSYLGWFMVIGSAIFGIMIFRIFLPLKKDK